MNNIYWIGPRQSDIDDTNFKFAGSITIYGSNINGNTAYCSIANKRINHNVDNDDCNRFFSEKLKEICHNDPKSQFLFYNFSYAYEFDDEIQKHVIGLNPYNIIDMLADKIRCRTILNNIVETIPFITLKGSECSFSNLCKYFCGYTEFIIQKKHSSGGEGTYIINSDSDVIKLNAFDEYMISPYIKDSISLNVHIAIINNKTIVFPPSIQIITEQDGRLLYHGADFICYQQISEKIKNEIKNLSTKIGDFVCKRGYKGVLGIDFLLNNETIYFMEINPRFQDSSQLVNRGLLESNQSSLFEIHLQSFDLFPIRAISDFDVLYSNYVFSTNNITKTRLKKIINSCEIEKFQADGYGIDCITPYEENSYLCRCIFKQSICCINLNNKFTLHPNLFVEKIASNLFDKLNSKKEYIKFALLNHGVTLTKAALTYSRKQGTIREAVFDAIDITIFYNISVNVPIKCKFVSFSPFTIDFIDNEYTLYWDDIRICTVSISFLPNNLINKKTLSGVPYDSIINLANDRIRINPAPICVYKLENESCQFCNLPTINDKYNINDIYEVIDYCLEYVDFRHFLIGGGTYSKDGGWNIILNITKYIRSKCNKDIYLMSIPPKELSILDKLKEAGITEVAFNLEMFDRNLAQNIMPGKGCIGLNQYLLAFRHSIKLWGNTGCVRSLLIYGFDTDDTFLSGIEQLCQLGVEPIISIFRPLENTELSYLNPPPTSDILKIYQKCQDIVQKHNLILGPDCPQCQNNTLSYTKIF